MSNWDLYHVFLDGRLKIIHLYYDPTIALPHEWPWFAYLSLDSNPKEEAIL